MTNLISFIIIIDSIIIEIINLSEIAAFKIIDIMIMTVVIVATAVVSSVILSPHYYYYLNFPSTFLLLIFTAIQLWDDFLYFFLY